MLFNEDLPLAQRFDDFRASFDAFAAKENVNHYQDLHAVSVYLTLRYPEKYFIYKYTVLYDFAENHSIHLPKSNGKHETFKIECNHQLCEDILNTISSDQELLAMSRARLNEDCYADPDYHMLANDILYFGSKHSSWWPASEEYDPKLTKDAWKKYILEVELPHPSSAMPMLKAMMELGGEASCKALSMQYGRHPTAYVNYAVALGKRIKQYFNLDTFMDGDQERFYPIPFVGKKKDGYYIFRIRKPLREALKEINLKDISKMTVQAHPKNTILYGPPGTGKTYLSVCYAVAIIESRPIEAVLKEAAKDYGYVFKTYTDYKSKGLIEFVTFHQSYGYEEFIEGIKPLTDENNEIKYEVASGIFKKFCESVPFDTDENRVFIIDEINRGNVSKIFGELITLIEDTKRIGAEEELKITLPYSQKLFGIPENVYILGTMNTADRSIAALDTALRRRFSFVEMMPDVTPITGIFVDGIDLGKMLEKINERIEVLFDREHTIGHAYFIKLKETRSIEALGNVFKNKILPLLQEYFYDDYEKIRLILGDNQVDDESCQFILESPINKKLFGSNTLDILDEAKRYSINNAAFENTAAYIKIYQ